MEVKLHKGARTTLKIREEIRNSPLSVYALSKKYNLSWNTVKKWKERDDIYDKSSRPNKLNTTLTKEDEDLILFERKQKKLSLDDIYCVLRDKIPNLYPMKIYRCLKRHGLDRLPQEFIKEESRVKKFKKYKIGFLHIDTLYTPKINKVRHYIFTCIDMISKLAYIMLVKNKTMKNSSIFLNKVLEFYPYKINYILTDNGQEFCYKALPKRKKTKKIHPFVKLCKENNIKHRTIKFKHPWTNGQVENLKKEIKRKVLTRYIFSDIVDLEDELIEFINDYNIKAKLKSLDYMSPKEYLLKNHNINI